MLSHTTPPAKFRPHRAASPQTNRVPPKTASLGLCGYSHSAIHGLGHNSSAWLRERGCCRRVSANGSTPTRVPRRTRSPGGAGRVCQRTIPASPISPNETTLSQNTHLRSGPSMATPLRPPCPRHPCHAPAPLLRCDNGWNIRIAQAPSLATLRSLAGAQEGKRGGTGPSHALVPVCMRSRVPARDPLLSRSSAAASAAMFGPRAWLTSCSPRSPTAGRPCCCRVPRRVALCRRRGAKRMPLLGSILVGADASDYRRRWASQGSAQRKKAKVFGRIFPKPHVK